MSYILWIHKCLVLHLSQYIFPTIFFEQVKFFNSRMFENFKKRFNSIYLVNFWLRSINSLQIIRFRTLRHHNCLSYMRYKIHHFFMNTLLIIIIKIIGNRPSTKQPLLKTMEQGKMAKTTWYLIESINRYQNKEVNKTILRPDLGGFFRKITYHMILVYLLLYFYRAAERIHGQRLKTCLNASLKGQHRGKCHHPEQRGNRLRPHFCKGLFYIIKKFWLIWHFLLRITV